MKTHKLKVTLNEIERMKELAGILNEQNDIEDTIKQAEDDGLLSNLYTIKDKIDKAKNDVAYLVSPAFDAFFYLAMELKEKGMLTNKSDAEKFITALFVSQFRYMLSKNNEKEIIKRFIKIFK